MAPAKRFSWDTGLLHTAASLVNSSQTSSKGPQSTIWERSKLGVSPSCGTLSQSPCPGSLLGQPFLRMSGCGAPQPWLPVLPRRLFTREPGCAVPPRNLQLQWSEHPHPGLGTRPGEQQQQPMPSTAWAHGGKLSLRLSQVTTPCCQYSGGSLLCSLCPRVLGSPLVTNQNRISTHESVQHPL